MDANTSPPALNIPYTNVENLYDKDFPSGITMNFNEEIEKNVQYREKILQLDNNIQKNNYV